MIKIGIFFGGKSREREISFAGGRTVYDNLDKTLFDAVPLFVDSTGKITQLSWPFIYKGTIRDFFPGPAINDGSQPYQIYAESLTDDSSIDFRLLQEAVGVPVSLEELPKLIDFGFLTLHGPHGEDGSVQGLLEWLGIPYSGSGILPSAFGINKVIQRKLMREFGFDGPSFMVASRSDILETNTLELLFDRVKSEIGFPCVVKAPHQGSSIGVSIVESANLKAFENALWKSFFLARLDENEWKVRSESSKAQWISDLLDVRTGIGMPVSVYQGNKSIPEHKFYHPDRLLQFLNQPGWHSIVLEAVDAEQEVLIESFIDGKEFSCIVIEGLDGEPLALPPTEIIKYSNLFDYRSKYLPGISRKITPIDVPVQQLESIRITCERMYKAFGFQVYARLDGFIKTDGTVMLNDPNTTSGMLPSSFFFHQSAEIGLNPSQFLTYIIYTSLRCRMKSGKERAAIAELLRNLDNALTANASVHNKKTKVGVVMGGYSTERHISMESGRNIYEKLSSSAHYIPIPIFLTGSDSDYRLYRLPVKMMLKDNADDIKKLVELPASEHTFITETIGRACAITSRFATGAIFHSEPIQIETLHTLVDEVFIALHGRPGEDGSIQQKLEAQGIPYNGSGIESSRKTINKFETNALLRQHGILVADHTMVYKSAWQQNPEALFTSIENQFPYPFIAKPADDGCSSAVKKIKSRPELEAFTQIMFRESESKPSGPATVLHLKANEEFPQKSGYLIETLIEKGEAIHFLEITGGMLTRTSPEGKRIYQVFEPSETLASGEVLSLEEKFLAGEGQNITPARFSKNPEAQKRIAAEVRETLQQTARILNVEGYCRIDAFVRVYADGRVETLVIEINSLPGMTPATCIFHQAAIDNLRPLDFISAILEYGKNRQHNQSENIPSH